MSTSTSNAWSSWPRAASARVDTKRLCVELTDGREISVPLTWFAWLVNATQAQRQDFRIVEDGGAILWEPLKRARGLDRPATLA